MKAVIVAAAAAVLAGGVSAGHFEHRHAHELFRAHRRSNDTEVCVPGCTTIYSVITGPAGLYTPPPAPSTSTSSSTSVAVVTSTSSSTPVSTPALVPTPIAQTVHTPGVYTFPATTVVVTETTIVLAASTTEVPSGTYTLGGVTTVVETETTIVCPYATTESEGGVVTSVLLTTTYVCPSAGTYTIAPITTVVATETVVVIPVVTTYYPGTYTAPAVVTTITETDTIIYCPFTSPAPAAPAAPTSAPPPPPASSSAPAASPSASSPKIGGGGKQLGITYTPYTEGGACKSADEVLADITSIKNSGITTVRIYSTDCDTLPNVGAAARAVGVKIIAGIFIGEVGCDNASPDVADQIAALKAWAQWDLVELLVVGNEAIFNKFCTVDQLRDLIVKVKAEVGSTGYSGPFTTTDVVSAWTSYDVSSICSVIDVVGTNAHAYFNAGTAPHEAGDFVAGQLKIVEDVCGKAGYILESGWPKEGKCFGKACPGAEEQKVALTSIIEVVGEKTVFFSYHNDLWKQPGDCQCERSWGCAELFGA